MMAEEQMPRKFLVLALAWMSASAAGLAHELWGRLPWLWDTWRRAAPQHLLPWVGLCLASFAVLVMVPRRWKLLGIVTAWLTTVVLAAKGAWFLGLPDGLKAILLLVWALSLASVATFSKLPLLFGVLGASLPAALGALSLRGWAIVGTLVTFSLAASGLGAGLAGAVKQLGQALGEKAGNQPGSPFAAWVQFLTALGVGVGCLSLLGLFFAEAGLAHPGLLGACLVLGLALFFLLPRGPRNWLALALSPSQEPVQPAASWLLGLGVALVGLFFLATLGPETGNDALGGRVALAARVLAAGQVLQWPGMVEFTAGYAGGEFFYLWLFPWIGDACARAWAWWVMLLWLVTAWLSRKSWALFAWLVVFASTHAWWQVFSGFVDLHQTFLLFVAALALANHQRGGEATIGFLVSFLMASAVATKINALPALPALFAWGAWRACQIQRGEGVALWPGVLRWLALSVLGFVLVLGPWALRSWQLTGNPTFPLFNGVWQSPQAPLEPVRAPFGPKGGVVGWLVAPWTLFFQPALFAELGAFNPLLALLPLGFAAFLPRDRRAIFVAAGFSLCVLGWALTEPNSRYLWPAVGFLLVGGQVSVLEDKKEAGALVAPAAALAVCAFFVQIASAQFWPARELNGRTLPLALVLGHESKDDYLSKLVPTYRACTALANRYGAQFHVWQVNVRDFLYCPGEAFYTFFGDYRVTRRLRELLTGGGLAPGEATRALRELGFTHVMFRLDSETPWHWVARDRGGGVLSEAEEVCCMVPEFADRGLRVFRLREDGGGAGSWESCPSFAFASFQQGDQHFMSTYLGSFSGGELFRLRVLVHDGQGADPRVDLAVRGNDRKKLFLFWRDTFGKRQPGQPMEIVQTLPEGALSVQLTVLTQRSRVQEVSCEVFRRQLDHDEAGRER